MKHILVDQMVLKNKPQKKENTLRDLIWQQSVAKLWEMTTAAFNYDCLHSAHKLNI